MRHPPPRRKTICESCPLGRLGAESKRPRVSFLPFRIHDGHGVISELYSAIPNSGLGAAYQIQQGVDGLIGFFEGHIGGNLVLECLRAVIPDKRQLRQDRTDQLSVAYERT
jgi:hypothetical protein